MDKRIVDVLNGHDALLRQAMEQTIKSPKILVAVIDDLEGLIHASKCMNAAASELEKMFVNVRNECGKIK